ncbi:MAG: DUF559 domain-containing protein [Selenomonas sp.]|nr:DUF559 domain-containing protein [Selenomonas sp.]
MKRVTYREDVKAKSQNLRRNMTKEERHLWYDFLKGYQPAFHRQKPIGIYVADFYCAAAKLVIEIDGGQHYEDAGKDYDVERTKFLQNLGIEVLRFSNRDVWENFSGVCEKIRDRTNKKPSSLGKVPRRGG